MEIREQRAAHQPRDVFDLIGRREQIERMAHAMRAIAHPLRLKILCVLGEQESSVQDIVEAVGTSQSNVSQHLAILREKGIVGSRRNANHVFYSVRDQRTLQLLSTMREVLCGVPRS
ncbi:MAG TPA: metalloregulator ArsR/SmtB family transcription factor [Burkholderiales bacterium]|nr:metalloregulator ArsR/SmtB family transcription factor [Burkholderiales bacterium]HYA46144.1 metalloregulator ArsR/SmtB family transcription factor [Burkholderiales bacterium]